MDKVVVDQAEGLRRLLARSGSRVLAVTGGSDGLGRTTTVVNLATALVGQGKDVLVIDECGTWRSAGAMLGTQASDFAAVLGGASPRRDPLGFSLLDAAPAQYEGLSAAELDKVFAGPADFVLIDARLDADGALSPLAVHAHDVLIVTRVAAQAITDTYACVKRLHFMHAIRQFRVLFAHVQPDVDTHVAFENLAGVARSYLSVSLELAGAVAADPRMQRALELARPVVDAFPSAASARDYRRVAAELQHWPMRPAVSSPHGVGGARVGASALSYAWSADAPASRAPAQQL